MSIDVYVSVVLRNHCGGKSSFTLDADTVKGVIDTIAAEYPGFDSHVLCEDGSIHRKVRVSVNGEDVSSLQGADTPVKPGDHVYLLLAVAGG